MELASTAKHRENESLETENQVKLMTTLFSFCHAVHSEENNLSQLPVIVGFGGINIA